MKIFQNIKCEVCQNDFRPLSSKQKTCSEKCLDKKHKRKDKNKVLKYFETPTNKRPVYKGILNLLKNRKLKVTDHRTIPYDSPTGRAFVGVAKKPLREVENGFGFKGVLLQTDNRMFIQCHICGKWIRQLTKRHLQKHKITKDKYKTKFGLMKSTSLVSDELSYSLEKRARIRLEKNPNSLNHLTNIAAKGLASQKRRKLIHNDEHNNRYGICEKQLGFRLIEYIKKYKDLPSRSIKGEGGIISKALYRRFKSLNQGFKHYGLPTRYRQGSNVELNAPNGKQLFFNYNKDYSKDKIWAWFVQNCPQVDPSSINKFAN